MDIGLGSFFPISTNILQNPTEGNGCGCLVLGNEIDIKSTWQLFHVKGVGQSTINRPREVFLFVSPAFQSSLWDDTEKQWGQLVSIRKNIVFFVYLSIPSPFHLYCKLLGYLCKKPPAFWLWVSCAHQILGVARHSQGVRGLRRTMPDC